MAREGPLDLAGSLSCVFHWGPMSVFASVYQESLGRSAMSPRISSQVQCVPSLLSLEEIGVTLVNSALLALNLGSNPISATLLGVTYIS